jgi:hypothetical protein
MKRKMRFDFTGRSSEPAGTPAVRSLRRRALIAIGLVEWRDYERDIWGAAGDIRR